MINIVFTLNGTDYSSLLSTYNVSHEMSYSGAVTTLDGTEHYGLQQDRSIVTFSLIPLTAAQSAALYDDLRGTVEVGFTDPELNENSYLSMKVDGSVTKAFALSSIDGNRYYKGEEITLRALRVR